MSDKKHETEPAVFKTALDDVAEAIALLGTSGEVLYSNRAARALFKADRGITVGESQRLLVTNQWASEQVSEALEKCERNVTGYCQDIEIPISRIAISSEHGCPLILTIKPLSGEIVYGKLTIAALFIGDLQVTAAERIEMMRRAYGLSAGEARLVLQLSDGFLLKEIAIRREVSYETVRSQLRRIMQKTGSRRQADVIRLVGRLT